MEKCNLVHVTAALGKAKVRFHMPKKKDHSGCYQLNVQKPASVMVWWCISVHSRGDLHICEGTIDIEVYLEFGKDTLNHQGKIFSMGTMVISVGQFISHSTQLTTEWFRRHRVCV